jgi:hypothetical protein
MNEPWSRDRIDQTLATWNAGGVCGASGWMRRTSVMQSKRQVFELAREHFGPNEKDGAA